MFHVVRKILFMTAMISVGAAAPTADFSFTGGKGANLSITFNTTFQLTLERESLYTRLVFHGLYAEPNSSGIAPLTRLSYTLGGAADTHGATTPALYDWNAPATASLAANDFMMPVSDATIASGGIYQFFSGQTVTTTGGWGSDPADYAPTFQIYLVDLFGNRASDIVNGTIGGSPDTAAIPEPATSALFASLMALSGTVAFRRRKRDHAVVEKS